MLDNVSFLSTINFPQDLTCETECWEFQEVWSCGSVLSVQFVHVILQGLLHLGGGVHQLATSSPGTKNSLLQDHSDEKLTHCQMIVAQWCHMATNIWVNIGSGNGLLPGSSDI